jgi:hypothetical protein
MAKTKWLPKHSKTGQICPVFEWLKQNGGQKRDFVFLTSSLDRFVKKFIHDKMVLSLPFEKPDKSVWTTKYH